MKRKIKLSERPHPNATLSASRISFPWRLIIFAIGAAGVVGCLWQPVTAIYRGEETVFYFGFFLPFASLTFVIGLFGYYPIFPEFNGFAPITSSMLKEIGKTILCLMPLAISNIAFNSWIESYGYEHQYEKKRGRAKLERIWAYSVFLKKPPTPAQVKLQIAPMPSGEEDPIHKRLPRQLIMNYDISTDGPPSAARIQELMRLRGSVGLNIFGEMSAEEWQRFCAEGAALPQPMKLSSCEGVTFGD